MTAFVLDTHAVVWAATNPDQLGDDARRIIADPNSQLMVSAASAWEIATKVRLGKFPEAQLLADQFESVVQRLHAEPMAITVGEAAAAGRLAWDHRDPFDRMLAAQAIGSGFPLITRDRAFADLGGLATLW